MTIAHTHVKLYFTIKRINTAAAGWKNFRLRLCYYVTNDPIGILMSINQGNRRVNAFVILARYRSNDEF